MPELNYILGDPYTPTWKGKPPHMLEADIPVWYDFLDKYGKDFLHFYYDVALTTKPIPPDVTQPVYIQMFYSSWGKRIDAVGVTDINVWIIEVAERAYLRAVGQLLTYIELWRIKPPIPKPFLPYLVTRSIDDDLIHAIDAYGINYILV